MTKRTGETDCQHLYSVSWLDNDATLYEACSSCGTILKPEGMVIVPESAVPDQAVIAAIRGLERRYAEWQQGSRDPEAEIVNAWLDAQEGRP